MTVEASALLLTLVIALSPEVKCPASLSVIGLQEPEDGGDLAIEV